MMIEDRSAAFVRYAAQRNCVRGPRGAVVRLARWHAPMLGREHAAKLPPLRNRYDVRRWAREAGQAALPNAVDVFVHEAVRLWLEFAGTLSDAERIEARATVELDADERRAAEIERAMTAWADAFGSQAVTAVELRRAWPVREAICSAIRPGCDPDEAISPTMVSRFVRDLAASGRPVADGWRIMDATPDRHEKVKRWALVRLSDEQGRGDVALERLL